MDDNNQQVGNEDDDDDVDDCITSFYTPNEMMKVGLKLAGYSAHQLRRTKNRKTNVRRFKSHYGPDSLVAAFVWEDLQRARGEEYYIPPKNNRIIKYYLMAMHFLKRYPTKLKQEALFDSK